MARMWTRAAVIALALVATAHLARSAAPRFYPDDPIWLDDDRVFDASGVVPVEDSNGYDFLVNTFFAPGERADIRALDVNTLDEVPDSMWFENRIGRRDLSIDEIVRGPDRVDRVSLDGWIVSAGKSTGLQPGFRMIDPADGNQLYQIEIDPTDHPEMATGAEIIGTAFYHAMGYHTVEVYLADLDPAKIVIAPTARIFDPLIGEKRPFTRRDLDRVLERGSRQPNGTYRVLASRFAPGAPLGNFRYHGTRPDDPNDIFPHEHRRELRGARVFGAWLNHDDSRGVNSLDMLETIDGKGVVRHYMFDFGSIMGSGTIFAQRHRAGNEYIFEGPPGWLTLATLGFYTRPWLHITYPKVPPSVGRFEGDAFDPLLWKPEYPNPAFRNMRVDDAFWAARIVARFSDRAIRAVVDKARYSDPRATEYITETLIKRRDKVLRTWLTAVTPLVEFHVTGEGDLVFANAAVDAGVAAPASSYTAAFARFDNTTQASTPLGSNVVAGDARIRLPREAAATPVGQYLEVRVSATQPEFPAWSQPVIVYLRRTASGWEPVGLTRIP